MTSITHLTKREHLDTKERLKSLTPHVLINTSLGEGRVTLGHDFQSDQQRSSHINLR